MFTKCLTLKIVPFPCNFRENLWVQNEIKKSPRENKCCENLWAYKSEPLCQKDVYFLVFFVDVFSFLSFRLLAKGPLVITFLLLALQSSQIGRTVLYVCLFLIHITALTAIATGVFPCLWVRVVWPFDGGPACQLQTSKYLSCQERNFRCDHSTTHVIVCFYVFQLFYLSVGEGTFPIYSPWFFAWTTAYHVSHILPNRNLIR